MDFKNTKIVCTIGPSSSDLETLKKLVENGMNVVRLNFSHGTHAEKVEQIKMIRQLAQDLDTSIAIFADLQGPKLRLGKIEGVRLITKDELVELTTTATDSQLPIQFDLSKYLKPGARVYLNDGLIHLMVISVENGVIKAKATNDGVVSSFKGINIPDTTISDGTFTQKDHEDAVFALEQHVDYLALSFVQQASDLDTPKKLIKEIYPKARIIAKIEKNEAIENLNEIIDAADAVMIARGDLGIEVDPSIVPVLQQRIIRAARQKQKPVIVATHMLESMIQNPSPTRAEASDVGNAVLSQVDAVMLSAESAAGKYPVEAVRFMNDTIHSVEQNPEFKQAIAINWKDLSIENVKANAITSTASILADRVKAKLIVIATSTGRTARIISSFRPVENIIAVTHDETTRNQLVLSWGIHPIIVKPTEDVKGFLDAIISEIKKGGFAKSGDTIIFIGGSNVGITGATDTIQVIVL